MLLLVLQGCVTSPSVRATSIQAINVGDTFEVVKQKVGEPHQILLKELTANGQERVVWLYEAVGKNYGFNPDDEQSYQLRRLGSPPYLIAFIDGKVSSIKRQGQ